jgi:hypothetical protein
VPNRSWAHAVRREWKFCSPLGEDPYEVPFIGTPNCNANPGSCAFRFVLRHRSEAQGAERSRLHSCSDRPCRHVPTAMAHSSTSMANSVQRVARHKHNDQPFQRVRNPDATCDQAGTKPRRNKPRQGLRSGREAPPPAVRIAQLVRSATPRSGGEPAGTIVVELLEARAFDGAAVPAIPRGRTSPNDRARPGRRRRPGGRSAR